MIILLFITSTVISLEVALFPSTGCYSHDVMMRHTGEAFDEHDNVTWVQTFLYNFGFGEIKLPPTWNRISIWGHDADGLSLMRSAGSLIWERNVPTDFDRPWDLRGLFSFFKMLERHYTFCQKMLVDQRFINYVNKQTTDVVVLDHFLQECMGAASYLLNASTVQFSNWPIADGYITSLNVPANPSATPKTGTPFTGLGMPFLQRVANFIFHCLIVLTRYIQIHVLDNLFVRIGYPWVTVVGSEAERIIYAGRSEFLFEVIRPINNRVKHFGATSCMDPSDYIIAIPSDAPMVLPVVSKPSESILSNSSISYLNKIGIICNSSDDHSGLRLSTSSGIDWKLLGRKSFILVSFGSVAQVENMPVNILRLFLYSFAQSPHTIIWQTNSPIGEILRVENITVPPNVIHVEWTPNKYLLAHPNLQYLICHGGINTVNELILFGVPVIGVPLQGDQGSNLRRLADLGAAEVISTIDIGRGKLAETMRHFEMNLPRYWARSSQLSAMLHSYRTFHRDDQRFWLRWTARNGKKLKHRRLFRLEYIGDEENSFWLSLTFLMSMSVLCLIQ